MKTLPAVICMLVLISTFAIRSEDQPAAGADYHVLQKEVLGGDGSWDYLMIDNDARQLYIARESRVMIVDLETRKLVKEISGLNGVHGVALAPEFKRGFISNGRDNTVTIFDLKTSEKTGSAKAGPKPDAIIYDAFSKRVFAFNNGGTTATAIDATSGDVAGSVELGGAPEFAVADGKGRIYVNLEDKNEVVEFDTAKLTALNHWPLAPGTTPTGLAMDLEHRRLFSGCRGTKSVVVLNADTGKVITSLPIGAGTDAAGFDPETQTVFCSNGDGTLTVIHEDTPDTYHVVQTVTTAPGARTMTLDTKTHHVWLVTAQPIPGKRGALPGTFATITVGK